MRPYALSVVFLACAGCPFCRRCMALRKRRSIAWRGGLYFREKNVERRSGFEHRSDVVVPDLDPLADIQDEGCRRRVCTVMLSAG